MWGGCSQLLSSGVVEKDAFDANKPGSAIPEVEEDEDSESEADEEPRVRVPNPRPLLYGAPLCAPWKPP